MGKQNRSQLTELPAMGKLRKSQFLPFVGIASSTVDKWAKEGRFPKGKRLSSTVTVWDCTELQSWINGNWQPTTNNKE